MISSLYFMTLGIWLSISIMEQRWGIVAVIIILGFFGGIRYLAPRKLSKESGAIIAKLAVLYTYLLGPYLVGDPKVKAHLRRLVSELVMDTCKDPQVSYAMLLNRWNNALAKTKKEVEEIHENQSEDS